MPLLIEISDDVLDALQLPREEAGRELRMELALSLYARGVLSVGKAAEMSQLSRWAFEDLLASRKVLRNYGEGDLEHDLQWRPVKETPSQ